MSEFYRKKSVFITGGSGFIGKALIEKLLRSCPEIGNIYMLFRPKRGVGVQSRLQTFLNEPVFKLLNESKNDCWKNKIKPIEGDVMELNLGLCEEDTKMLRKNVNIFFHVAATVNFHDPFKIAVLTNVRGTREACNLALKMENLQLFFYVSTAYSNSNRKIIDEILYPAPTNWKDTIQISETMNLNELQIISKKFLGSFPNSYTFSKCLSEHVVNDLCVGKIRTIILRPSIVISAMDEPILGWTDNFNGPFAFYIGSGKGVIHTVIANLSTKLNMIPVDYTIKAILAAGSQLNKEDDKNKKQLKIYNACNTDKYNLTLKNLNKICENIVDEYPLSDPLWYTSCDVTNIKIEYYVKFVLYHLLPSILIDTILRCFKKKPFLLKLIRKTYLGNNLLLTFTTNTWTFVTDNYLKLIKSVKDDPDFSFEHKYFDYNYFKNIIISSKLYLLKEGIDFEKDRKRLYRMKILHYFVKYSLRVVVLYLIIVKSNLIELCYNCFY